MKCQDCFTTGYKFDYKLDKIPCSCSIGQGITERIIIRLIAFLKAGI